MVDSQATTKNINSVACNKSGCSVNRQRCWSGVVAERTGRHGVCCQQPQLGLPWGLASDKTVATSTHCHQGCGCHGCGVQDPSSGEANMHAASSAWSLTVVGAGGIKALGGVVGAAQSTLCVQLPALVQGRGASPRDDTRSVGIVVVEHIHAQAVEGGANREIHNTCPAQQARVQVWHVGVPNLI